LALSIVRGSIADVDSLQELWVAVHHAHAASMPELAPYVSDAETWAHERPLYVALLAKPDTLLLLARDGDELVGYALAHVTAVEDTWVPDTWQTGPRIGELESLGVVEGRRGEGIGNALLDAVEREFAALGVEDFILGVLPGNEGARRLYERRGFRPTWLYLSRFAGR
jgi:ribosomal protein S18 acetylase RimI-like enzyme